MNYPSTHFVESAGTVLFDLSTRQICLLHHISSNEYLLPKGRRNLGESRPDAAIRETREETGWTCRLSRVKMWTRCTLAVSEEESRVENVPRRVDGVVEPFMLTQRMLPAEKGKGVKIIWWFVGVVEEAVERGKGEEQFEAELLSFEAAVDRLTFPDGQGSRSSSHRHL
ncbi:unnamed protein product [Zymoseptoria tritici ST99CH_1A5]|nr:unnamed protein product [Zymoseptoria tritici ST99CH_3D1]SMY20895.1 unnamed protein product [Zymoseptoria tritici ST99CH_1A5]